MASDKKINTSDDRKENTPARVEGCPRFFRQINMLAENALDALLFEDKLPTEQPGGKKPVEDGWFQFDEISFLKSSVAPPNMMIIDRLSHIM